MTDFLNWNYSSDVIIATRTPPPPCIIIIILFNPHPPCFSVGNLPLFISHSTNSTPNHSSFHYSASRTMQHKHRDMNSEQSSINQMIIIDNYNMPKIQFCLKWTYRLSDIDYRVTLISKRYLNAKGINLVSLKSIEQF